MRPRRDPPRLRRAPLALVPLLVYLGVTLLAPALHGAGRHEGFWEHAAVTLGVSALVSWPWLVLNRQPARARVPTALDRERGGIGPAVAHPNERNDSA